MDPGPWYATYSSSSSSSNRSSAGAVSSAFSTDHNLDQTLLLSSSAVPAIVSGSVENGGGSIIVSTSSSAPQIILQATHTTASLGSSGQTSPFSPTSFLQASGAAPVSYDVFSPFSFNSPKQATSYVSAQSVGGTAQGGVSSSQPGSPEEASYASSQNNDSYYRTSTSSPTAAWSLTNPKTQTTQDNPFGILPHESVTAVASPPQATKQQQQQQPTNSSNGSYSVYSPQNGSATEAAKTPSAWSSSKQQQQSRTTTESPIDDNASFYNHHNGGASAYSPADGTHQSCIVTTPNVLSSSSPVPTTIYLTAATTTTQNQQTVVANSHDESSQSSPVSYSIMSYASPSQASQASNNGKASGNGAAATVQFHVLGQAQQQRLYATTDQEYHHPVRSKSAASTDSAYSSSTSQNGPDCGGAPGVVPRRPSPMQSSSSHSQASPLGHVPSPATYPMYNSPMTSMSSPSPLQQQQQQAGNVVQMTPPSPMIDAVTRSPSQQQQNQVVYSSVITRALGTQNDSGVSKAYNTADGSNYERTQDYVQTTKQLCPWDGDIQQQQQQTTTAYLTGSDQSDTRVLTTQQIHGLLDDHHQQQHQHQHHHHLETSTINLQDLSTDDDPRELNGRRCAKIAPKRALPMTTGLESELANSVSYQLEALTASGQVVLNAQTSQQNGGYIELERWNLTPLQNGAKIIAAAPAAAASTYVTTQQQQHQQQQQQSAAAAAAAQVVQAASLVTANPTLLVAHPPTISYYPTFHIAQATPHITTHLQPQQQPQPQTTTVVSSDLQHTIEISTLDLQNDCQQHLPQQQQQQPQLITIQQQDINSYNPDNVVREERPQVIVPDIEEELGFLKQVNNTTTTTTQRHSQHQQQNRHQHNHHNNGHYHNQQSRHSNNQQLHLQHQQQHNNNHHNNHHGVVTNSEPNSGFMTSFLKFLQGEKDSSPPPLARGGRKTGSWPKAVNKPYSNSASNSADAWSNNRNSTTTTTTTDTKDKPAAIDYANDPRYFPLPKERKRFDSSDDGFSSSENELGGSSHLVAAIGRNKAGKSKENSRQNGGGDDSNAAASGLPYGLGPALPIKPPEGRPKKGRPIKPGGPTDRKRKAAAAAAAAAAEAAAKGLPYPPIPESKKKKLQQQQQSMPRRESSRRKAKEKPKLDSESRSAQGDDPNDEMDDELGDSDSDPAWTPVKSSADEDEHKHRRKRGRPPVIFKRGYNKRHSDFLDDSTSSTQQQHHQPKRPGRKRKNHVEAQRVANSRSSGLAAGSVAGNGGGLMASAEDRSSYSSHSPLADDEIDIAPFKSGEFVVIKTDLDQEYPPLWRIDGKTLLQKYEPFQANGKTLYRNISTYSGWAPQSRYIYQSVPVKFWQQNKEETIVEFLRDQMTVDEGEAITRFMKDTEKYQDNFEVYIQTLISQALDSNFLTEIFQEQDEYFLLNVKKVDEITEERKQRLLSTTKWQSNVITALSTWPCINLLKDNIADRNKTCSGCGRVKLFSRILLYGQPYNSTTLEGCPPVPQVPQEKDFLFCRVCQTKVNLFNKVAHQKYLMFLECARMVAQKRAGDVHKDTTIILNELLADEAWLNQLFRDVRAIWAEIDSLHEKVRKKAEKLAAAAAAAAESENKQQEQQSQELKQQQHQQQQQSNLQDNFNNEAAQQQMQLLQQQQQLQIQQEQIRQNQLQRQQLNLQQRLMNGLSYS
uniref:DUF4211 domain-containing protein n=1 Tax=Trichogramma kaykai TaxID=54128 RepID=A0ABD2XCJ4_9HYME